MARWICSVCNAYEYDEEKGDPDSGILPGTRVADLPDDWRCPVCGATKDKLVKISEEELGEKGDTDEISRKFGARKRDEEQVRIRAEKPVEQAAGKSRKETTRKGSTEKKVIIIGPDNPEAVKSLGQEYGKALGLGGIGQGISYLNNFKALAAVKLKTRLITEHRDPVLECDFFGTNVSMPVFGAPMSGLSYVSPVTEEDFSFSILEGCRQAGTLGFTGNTSKEYEIHPGILALRKVGGRGVNIFKPQTQEVLTKLIRQAEEEGAVAVGTDLDGAGSVNFTLSGKAVFRKTVDDLRELKNSTKLPFIAKGIMCVEDALAAVEAGVDGIAVSNHGGRVLDCTPGVAEVLPEIAKAVRSTPKRKDLVILADGGIRTGFDVVKMLALGADFVLIGRPLAREALPYGAEGVARFLEFIKTDIKKAMIMTSCNTLAEIDESILARENK